MALITFSLLGAFQDEFVKAANEVQRHRAHWGGMAAFALTLLILGYLAAFRVHRWPILAWTTGVSVILYAAVSVSFKFDASARPDTTAFFAVVWGIGFLITARRATPVPAVRRDQTPVTVEAAIRPDAAPKKPGVALVAAAGFAVALNVLLGATGSDAAGPTLVLALVLVGIVVTRWRRWRRGSRSPEARRPTRLGALRLRTAPVRAVAGFVGLLLVGVVGAQLAREISPPPVPHSIESTGRSFVTARSYCVSCHATGEQQATRIDLSDHSGSVCIDCHAVPPVGAESALGSPVAAPWSDYRPTRLQASISPARLDPVEARRVAALVRDLATGRSR